MNLNVCSLTLLSLNSLKYSLGVATAAAGDPVVLIMSLLSLRSAFLSKFNHIKSSFFYNPIMLGFSRSVGIFIRSLESDQCCDFDQFLPGLLSSSPLYFCPDPRSQFSGGGIIRAQASDLEPVAARNDAARVTRNK